MFVSLRIRNVQVSCLCVCVHACISPTHYQAACSHAYTHGGRFKEVVFIKSRFFAIRGSVVCHSCRLSGCMKEVGVTFPATTADFVCSKVNLEMQKKRGQKTFFLNVRATAIYIFFMTFYTGVHPHCSRCHALKVEEN